MTAEILREAAALMRERAEAASPAPWHAVDSLTFGSFTKPVACVWDTDDALVVESHVADDPDVVHIASWHPAVALAVADWLEDALEAYLTSRPGNYPSTQRAVTIASAYLGRDA